MVVRMTTGVSNRSLMATASPMSGRLARSRLPPQPDTVTIRLKPAPRSALRTLINASGVCA